MARPNTYFLDAVRIESMPHILALLGVFGVVGLLTWRRRAWDALLVLMAAAYLYTLSMSVIMFHRYALPVVVFTYLIAGLGAVHLIQWTGWRSWRRAALTWACLALIVGLQLPRCLNYLRQFEVENDSRQRVRRWIIDNVPRGTRVLAESYTCLAEAPTPDTARLGVQVVTRMFAPDEGDLERLRQRGYAYVVVCDANFARFLAPQVSAAPGAQRWYEHHRRFYDELFANYPCAWDSRPQPNMYAQTNPWIRVYRLTGN
jgi:hypothetical protein